MWRGGRLTLIPVADAGDVVATRLNGSGDVLLQGGWRNAAGDTLGYNYTAVRVWRADGTLLNVGPLRIYAHTGADSVYYPRRDPYSYGVCCAVAGDLTDRREVVASSGSYIGDVLSAGGVFPTTAYVRMDVATGAVLDSGSAPYMRSAADGRLAGTVTGYGYGHAGQGVVTRGFTLSAMPAGPMLGHVCDVRAGGRWRVQYLLDLDDAADALVGWECGNFAYHTATGSVWVDRYVGPIGYDAEYRPQIHLARQGGLVAALDTTGAVYVWNAATSRSARVRAPLGAVTLDALDAVNAAGQIVAHGVDAATGRGGAYLLAPASR